MKKKIVGIVAAALLLGGSIGFAASSSLIGAKVSGMYTIKQDGKKIADAIVVNNSAYVPVRTMSEATGAGLTVEGKTIILESKETEKAALKASIAAAKLRERLAGAESSVQVLKEAIQLVETTAADLTSAADQEARRNYIAELNKRVAFMETEIAQLKEQLGE
ncbi:hypothetical protein CA600_24635 [Paenibacillus sp. VTT E-133280]|jgi:hypothetical protein|uniref:hypothetical protein n=1 Tax=Paenibacillus TaxID=44249 RepID=UPI000BA0BD58|nr:MULTISPECIES: hypothetical protein [unclassified Paenibacillus]MDH6369765.1 hypothetical protein [Paenibacillus sp. PastF-3]OZQ61656.1 hypothetical protein CA600_24635 [Paenibacillus sp. VTT E-133280]OZQ93645.1 hypothetical protein CA598_10175 [Paenibacillus sp. VTT E-133291]